MTLFSVSDHFVWVFWLAVSPHSLKVTGELIPVRIQSASSVEFCMLLPCFTAVAKVSSVETDARWVEAVTDLKAGPAIYFKVFSKGI